VSYILKQRKASPQWTGLVILRKIVGENHLDFSEGLVYIANAILLLNFDLRPIVDATLLI
jgi:hypothetical protein